MILFPYMEEDMQVIHSTKFAFYINPSGAETCGLFY